MTEKPRIRVKAGQFATDSYQNFEARLGVGTGNLMDGATYSLTNLITRMPRQLEFMYRGSWIVGAAVDSVADDMTRAGVDFGAALKPDDIDAIHAEMEAIEFWQSLGDVIRWTRLYGGAIGVMLIDGQDMATPLRVDTISQGQFRGILPLDRWSLMLTTDQIVTGMGPNLGRPEFYQVGPNAPALVQKKIHHSRVIRMEGVRLPFVQRQAEQGWGLSIVERMYDRLLAFDSATSGSAQLIFKAYLRTLKVEGLRQILSGPQAAQDALAKNVEAIRRFQSSEGLTLVDAKDDFQTHAYTFTGLDDILLQFGQQISGATEIPLVRLFGQSPAGLNSTGEGDIRLYYDGINSKQNRTLKGPVMQALRVLHASVTGRQAPDGFVATFNPLWQLSDKEKGDIAKATAETVIGAFDAALIGRKTALQELKQSADVTGIFSNITDEEIEAADEEPPAPASEDDENPPAPVEANPSPTVDAAATLDLHGLRLVIETPKGAVRQGGEGIQAWQVVMPADYGFIDGTTSAEGPNEEMDCFVGPYRDSPTAWVIDQLDPFTGAFDEHKVMLGYRSGPDAARDYMASFNDGRGFDRMGALVMMPIIELKAWLQRGRFEKPIADAA